MARLIARENQWAVILSIELLMEGSLWWAQVDGYNAEETGDEKAWQLRVLEKLFRKRVPARI